VTWCTITDGLPLWWQKETFPKVWKEEIIMKVPKKEHLSQCRNWWGITLLAVISKIFNKIILERIKNSLEMDLRKEQAGFRHNRSCIDQINTLRVIIEQSIGFQSPLYLVFVDYQRAFDSLSRAWIWDDLKFRGLPGKFINIIKEGYEDFSCRVLHEGQLSDSIKQHQGSDKVAFCHHYCSCWLWMVYCVETWMERKED
jgi:hypothetical protein